MFLEQVDASNPLCVPEVCYKLLRNIELDSDLAGIGVRHCQAQLEGGGVAIYVASGTSIPLAFGPVVRLFLSALGWGLEYLAPRSGLIRLTCILDKVLRQAIMVCALINMWVALWMLLFMHWAIDRSPGSGSLPMNEWTFDQILSTMTWIPVLVEAVYLAMCDYRFLCCFTHRYADFVALDSIETALNDRVPEEYIVVPDQDEAREDEETKCTCGQDNGNHLIRVQSSPGRLNAHKVQE